MRFNLIDKIVEVQAGSSLKAIKNLTLGEEYLADHFPTFPVMPGVLMLETLQVFLFQFKVNQLFV